MSRLLKPSAPAPRSNSRRSSRRAAHVPGLYYNRFFISRSEREQILDWLSTIHPIWENRFSKNNPPPEGETQRELLRPVYWLGNWQFACLNYYSPPKGTLHRCVRAEPFPAVLAKLVAKIEATTRRMFVGKEMPPGWHLNTCLVNLYGSRIEGSKRIDTARVGEHKDYEPGPVASLSLGERAMFQFVASKKPGQKDSVVLEQWLDDGSLQIFGGHRWKTQLFHRVQRVDKREGHSFKVNVEDFETRRLNFTFRYVPVEHIVSFASLPRHAKEDVADYMKMLAAHSSFFAGELKKNH